MPEDPDPRPVAPPKPQAGECCESGCDPCVYDRYWDALERYERALADRETRRQP
ncbi:MAG TPA: oxidoreductase-like domain-containing protein [Burkholderiales bacterium]|nr:oxidoreductase-like domain-containing protein [Burkholderiales bacterium]